MSGRIDEASGAAEAEIDGYCAAKYTVPLSPVPSIVNKLSVEISIYYLYSRRTVPEKIEKRYDKAIARLKDISLGRLSLGVQPVPAPAPVEAAQTNMMGRDRVFTRDKMRGF
jgi:phage gp36-like protein